MKKYGILLSIVLMPVLMQAFILRNRSKQVVTPWGHFKIQDMSDDIEMGIREGKDLENLKIRPGGEITISGSDLIGSFSGRKKTLIGFNLINAFNAMTTYGKPYYFGSYTLADLNSDNLILQIQPDFTIIPVSEPSSSSVSSSSSSSSMPSAPGGPSGISTKAFEDRIASLESEVARLRKELADCRKSLGEYQPGM